MIFNLFKSKPTLKELIPNGFVDIHSHILPGIDDGAKNLEESIELILMMRELGFSKIIGTPHTYSGLYNNTKESIKEAFNKVKKTKIENISLNYSSEYMIDHSLIKKSKKKDLLCLKDNYVLVEMSYMAAPTILYDAIFQLIHNGYIPIIAHPERYQFMFNNFREYFKLKNLGCYFQLNLLSTVNYYGKNTTIIADKLLKNNLIDFVGSDIHSHRHVLGFKRNLSIKEIEKLNMSIEKNSLFF